MFSRVFAFKWFAFATQTSSARPAITPFMYQGRLELKVPYYMYVFVELL